MNISIIIYLYTYGNTAIISFYGYFIYVHVLVGNGPVRCMNVILKTNLLWSLLFGLYVY